MSLAPYYRTYSLAWEDDPEERSQLWQSGRAAIAHDPLDRT